MELFSEQHSGVQSVVTIISTSHEENLWVDKSYCHIISLTFSVSVLQNANVLTKITIETVPVTAGVYQNIDVIMRCNL